jgi:hypothetical protein
LLSFTLSWCPPYSHWYQYLDNTCFIFLSIIFEKRHFSLFKITIHGISFWHFYVFMHHKPNWFIFSLFSPLYLSLLLMVISTGLNLLVQKVNLLYSSSFLPSFMLPFLLIPTHKHDLFFICPPMFRCLFIVQWDFCLSIIPVHALCLHQSKSPPLLFFTISPFFVVEQFTVCFLCFIPIEMWYLTFPYPVLYSSF